MLLLLLLLLMLLVVLVLYQVCGGLVRWGRLRTTPMENEKW